LHLANRIVGLNSGQWDFEAKYCHVSALRFCVIAMRQNSGMTETFSIVHPAGRVAWSRLSGNEVEDVVAIMICREHPRSNRVRPSRGDGGVDILIPPKPAERFPTVYQIKRFSGQGLSSSQKKKIADSLRQVRLTRNDQLLCWNLVLPMDRTPEQAIWFDELTSDCPFECNWQGLTHLDSLAAKYDEVIDYYLRGGRAAVENRLTNVLDATRLMGSSSLTPAESQNGLISVLKTVNATDPHFLFEFAATADPDSFVPADGYILKFVWTQDNENFVTFVMRSRYREALKDRPIPILASLQLETPELQQALRSLLDHGIGEIETIGELNHPNGLPGGFNMQAYEPRGLIRIGPSIQSPPEITPNELVIYGPEGHAVARLSVTCSHVGGGIRGISMVLADESQTLTITLIMDNDHEQSKLQITVDPIKFTGWPVLHCAAVMQFVDSLKCGNKLAFLIKHGGELLRTRNLDVDFGEDQFSMFRDFLTDLTAVQSLCMLPIKFPPEATTDEVRNAYVAAKLIRRGSLEYNWTEIHLHGAEVGPPVPPNQLLAHVPLPQIFTFALAGDEIWSCDIVDTITNAVTDSSVQNDDGTHTLRLVPGVGSLMTRRIVD
jgi:hypothetical protein